MKRRPNVLILLTDQQRYDTLAAAGFPHMITPNLDRLAGRGTMFTHAHSSNPVCMPARHDLLTGLPGRAHGYFSNGVDPIRDTSLPTLPRIFQNAGYRTAAVGKCHFHPAREHHGYGELHLMEELPEWRADDQYATWLKTEGLERIQNLHGVRPHIYHIPQQSQTDLAHHGTTWVADRAIRWMEDNGDAPFLLTCGWIHPHPPWNNPKEYQGIYKGADLPEPVPLSRTWPEPEEPNPWFGDLDTPEQKRAIREAYYESVTCVDHAVGRVLDYLEASGKWEDTLILFTSDHGEMLQDKGYYSKELPYEGSVRIPLIVKAPGGKDVAEVREDFVDLLDILPTCLDVAGLERPDCAYPLPGASLLQPRNREIQISATFGAPHSRWVMARTRTHKYVYTYNGGFEELYDLEADPREEHRIQDEAVAAPLREAVLAWEREWGPDWAVEGDRLAAFPAKAHHPSQCGKQHLWSNMQCQKFDRRSAEERGQVLADEMAHALSDESYSRVTAGAVFPEPEWMEHLLSEAEAYGDAAPLRALLERENG